MEVLVFRHAQAVATAASDADRELTAKGERQARLAGEFCRAHELVPGLILSSPIRRAIQSAERFAAACGCGEAVVATPAFACGAGPESFFDQLSSHRGCARLMVVGHQPDLGGFLAAALGCSGGIEVKKAALACLELSIPRAGAGSLRFHLPPRLMTA